MFALKAFCICLLACVVVAIGENGTNVEVERIVGGRTADRGQFPYMVSIRDAHYNFHLCAGAIISNRWVLTAAQCTRTRRQHLSLTTIRVGSHSRFDGTQYYIDRMINHPKHDWRAFTNDIGLVRTKTPIVFNKNIRPVNLPTADIGEGASARVLVSGWGDIRHPNVRGQGTARLLQWMETVTMSRKECRQKLASVRQRLVHPNSLCTARIGGRGACRGDNGNPLVTHQNRVLVGVVVSFACGTQNPDVYSRVFPHLAFIRATMQAN